MTEKAVASSIEEQIKRKEAGPPQFRSIHEMFLEEKKPSTVVPPTEDEVIEWISEHPEGVLRDQTLTLILGAGERVQMKFLAVSRITKDQLEVLHIDGKTFKFHPEEIEECA